METTKRGGEATSGGGITSNGGSISPHHPHIHPPTGHGAFGQQSIPAWQPVLAPRWTIIGLVVLGIVCVTLGTVLTLASNSVVECSIRYNDPSKDCGDACVNTIILTKDHCQGPLQTIKDTDYIPGKSFLYYALTQFHQNHRRYLLSRSEAQLAGDAIIDPDLLKDCEPALMSEDGYTILSPCGLAAKSVFNDTYKLKSQTGEYYALKETLDDIVWPESIKTRYKNPTLNGEDEQKKINQWLDDTIFPGKVENPHFIIWMRNAALPNFKYTYILSFLTSIAFSHINLCTLINHFSVCPENYMLLSKKVYNYLFTSK